MNTHGRSLKDTDRTYCGRDVGEATRSWSLAPIPHTKIVERPSCGVCCRLMGLPVRHELRELND